MARGQTTGEFRATFAASHPGIAEYWAYHGGNPGDPGWVSDEARAIGDEFGLDAEALDDAASDDGWEFHDTGYRDKIRQLARRAIEGSVVT